MFNPSSRIQEQIVDLLTKAHSSQDVVAQRVHYLQQAMELLLYHTTGNERIDEFLETFLSMHVDKQIPVKRFVAHFIEVLCFTRSRYSCSCLEVLVTLLQDADKQVVIFALRAARVVYKRALFYISVQQKDTRYTTPARESLQTLDHVLAQIVHHIMSGNREVFCEAIRCAQTVVLCQSFSSLNPKSQSQLEIAGCSCLEDLRLIEVPTNPVLEESKLKTQADKLFSALCALLVKHRAEPMEVVALIHAVGIVGHDRSSYAGASTIAFSQLAANPNLISNNRVRNALTMNLKRILSSRYCVQWQPRIIPILNSLGISTNESSTNLVMEAETDRLRDTITAEMGMSINAPSTAGEISLEKEGEKVLAITETADCYKVPDEDHAVAVCSVRAKSPAELAKLALAMLNRLPKKFDDPSMALVKVNRNAAATAAAGGHSIGFENRIKAVKSMGITFKRYLDGVVDGDQLTSDEEAEMHDDNPRPNLTTPMATDDLVRENVNEPEVSVPAADLLASIAHRDKRMFSRLVSRITSMGDTVALRNLFASELHSGSIEGISELFTVLYVKQISGDAAMTVESAGEILGSIISTEFGIIDINMLRNLLLGSETTPGIPSVPSAIMNLLDHMIEVSDPPTRRIALTLLSSIILTKPGMSSDALERLLNHASSDREEVRNDSLKLMLAKLYRPSNSVTLKWQWPYKDNCPLKRVESMEELVKSRLELLCTQIVEERANERLHEAVKQHRWSLIWPILALASKKPLLIHHIVHVLVEEVPDNVPMPTEIISSFAASLAALPGEVVDHELELVVKEYKSIRAVGKKKRRNDILLPILSALSNTTRGLSDKLADAALSLNK
jgi:hypothetical protein